MGESVSLFREQDAGNPPVRFDEREQETELRQAGLSGSCESTPTTTGRLRLLRLFSTLLAILHIDSVEGVLSGLMQQLPLFLSA